MVREQLCVALSITEVHSQGSSNLTQGMPEVCAKWNEKKNLLWWEKLCTLHIFYFQHQHLPRRLLILTISEIFLGTEIHGLISFGFDILLCTCTQGPNHLYQIQGGNAGFSGATGKDAGATVQCLVFPGSEGEAPVDDVPCILPHFPTNASATILLGTAFLEEFLL